MHSSLIQRFNRTTSPVLNDRMSRREKLFRVASLEGLRVEIYVRNWLSTHAKNSPTKRELGGTHAQHSRRLTRQSDHKLVDPIAWRNFAANIRVSSFLRPWFLPSLSLFLSSPLLPSPILRPVLGCSSSRMIFPKMVKSLFVDLPSSLIRNQRCPKPLRRPSTIFCLRLHPRQNILLGSDRLHISTREAALDWGKTQLQMTMPSLSH